MLDNTTLIRSAVLIAIAIFSLAGCGGSKILKEPKPMEHQGLLAAESHGTLAVVLEWVIVRDGPGTWSKNADWDEHLFRVHNVSSSDVTIESVVIYDSLETMVVSGADRKQLIKGSKAASKRYETEGLEVKAGLGAAGLAASGAAAYVGGSYLAVATLTGAAGTGAGTAVVALGAAFVAAPALLVGGMIRGSNNNSVGQEIANRQTSLPLRLSAGEEVPLDLFFPLSPSPVKVEINYSDAAGSHVLILDTKAALDGLHLRESKSE